MTYGSRDFVGGPPLARIEVDVDTDVCGQMLSMYLQRKEHITKFVNIRISKDSVHDHRLVHSCLGATAVDHRMLKRK